MRVIVGKCLGLATHGNYAVITVAGIPAEITTPRKVATRTSHYKALFPGVPVTADRRYVVVSEARVLDTVIPVIRPF